MRSFTFLGRLIGAIAGYIALGFWGVLLGYYIGRLFDRGFSGAIPLASAVSKTRENFFRSVFSVMGAVCKADGRISEMEIRTAEQVISQLGLNPEQRANAIREFNRGKSDGFDLNAEIESFKAACRFQPNLYRIFLEIQLQAVTADGRVQREERELVVSIARLLGLNQFELAQLEALLSGARAATDAPTPNVDRVKAAYGILGISDASNESEIKKAYRKLMSQHHPDKLAAKGLPPEMAKMATKKTQEIRAAYDLIMQNRGFA